MCATEGEPDGTASAAESVRWSAGGEFKLSVEPEMGRGNENLKFG